MKSYLLLLLLLPLLLRAQQPKSLPELYKEDFDYFWNTINTDYCYFDKKQTDWNAVKQYYRPQLDTIKSRPQFIRLLENVLNELYDHHASLNTNLPTSQRLVPSGADVWAEFIKGKAIITDVRNNSDAQQRGIVPGMEVTAINDVPIMTAIQPFLGKNLKKQDSTAMNYALRVSLAGNHAELRHFTTNYKGETKIYPVDGPHVFLETVKYDHKIESNVTNNIGYIKINNCLFDNDIISLFDSVMTGMKNTRALILDLRETPSGGNTTVARAILGWFISKEHFYQKHELFAEEKESGIKRSWMEIVSPRAGKYYGKPLYVLAGHWTGSLGEAITIAFDGMKRATVIGTELARLNGAVYSYETPNSKIGFSFPVERLYQVNGTPREKYRPAVYIDLVKNPPKNGEDIFMKTAMKYILKQK